MSCLYEYSNLISKLNLDSKARLIFSIVNNSKLIINILKLLYKNGVIRGFNIQDKKICVFLKYLKGSSIFSSLKLISRAGKRIYWSKGKLANKYSSFNFSGFYIISTSKGLITSNEALLIKGISGEILIQVKL